MVICLIGGCQLDVQRLAEGMTVSRCSGGEFPSESHSRRRCRWLTPALVSHCEEWTTQGWFTSDCLLRIHRFGWHCSCASRTIQQVLQTGDAKRDRAPRPLGTNSIGKRPEL